MSFRMGLRPLGLFLALFAFGRMAPAQTKVAIVNLQRAVFETAEVKQADKEMGAKFKPAQDAIDQLNREIADLAKRLQDGQGKLSAQQEADITAQGQKKERDRQRRTEDLQAESQAYRNEVLSRCSQKMTEVVKKIADERGLDLVVDTSTTLYFKPAMEITNDAIAAYDKAYPVTAAAPAGKK